MLELIKPAEGSVKKRKRKGRGNASGKGGECGRGHKGQASRTGSSRRPGFEGGQTPLFRRMPKLRGFKAFDKRPSLIVSLTVLSERYQDGDSVDINRLKDDGVLKGNGTLKVLSGVLDKKLTVKANAFSKVAQSAIEKAGGQAILA